MRAHLALVETRKTLGLLELEQLFTCSSELKVKLIGALLGSLRITLCNRKLLDGNVLGTTGLDSVRARVSERVSRRVE